MKETKHPILCGWAVLPSRKIKAECGIRESLKGRTTSSLRSDPAICRFFYQLFFCTATETPARNNSSGEGFVLCCSFIMHARNSGPAVTGKPSPGDPTSTSEAPVPTGLAHVRATSGEQTHKWALGDFRVLYFCTFEMLSDMIMYVMHDHVCHIWSCMSWSCMLDLGEIFI